LIKNIKNQITAKRINEGKNPEKQLITGMPNIPAPIEVPEISKILPKNLFVLIIIFSRS